MPTMWKFLIIYISIKMPYSICLLQQQQLLEEVKLICSEIWPTFNYRTSTLNFKYIAEVLVPEVGKIRLSVQLMYSARTSS